MSIEDFVQLKSFVGRVTKLEDVGIEDAPSVSGPDFRITVTAEDGSVIIVDKMPTMFGGAECLRKFAEAKKCELPGDIDLCWDYTLQWRQSVNGLSMEFAWSP